MKLLALCGFLFVCFLCLSVFAAEGQKVRKRCCLKVPKFKKYPHQGMSFTNTSKETKRYCKPCRHRVPGVFSGPLPQLK